MISFKNEGKIIDEDEQTLTFLLSDNHYNGRAALQRFKKRANCVLQNYHGEVVAIDNDGKVLNKEYVHAAKGQNGEYDIEDVRC